MSTFVRRPTLDEAADYALSRFKRAVADGNEGAAAAYSLMEDYLRNARFDEIVSDQRADWRASPSPDHSGHFSNCPACSINLVEASLNHSASCDIYDNGRCTCPYGGLPSPPKSK